MRVLGFDYGKRKIGIASGQTITKTAQPLVVISHTETLWKTIAEHIEQWRPDLLLVGLPLNMDGSPGDMSREAEGFAEMLKQKFNTPVVLRDERLSTRAARWHLDATSPSSNKSRKAPVDALAAAILVESWLNEQP